MTTQHSSHERAVRDVLERHVGEYASVLPTSLFATPPFIFDFSERNNEINTIDMRDPHLFQEYITRTLERSGAALGIGRYGEDRIIYRQSSLFAAHGEARSVHLAIDLFAPEGTPVFAPLASHVHSFQVNDHFLDYGPTIILEHELDGVRFFTLYGHLAARSLDGLTTGQDVARGEHIATVGRYKENGNWPPHLHFQIITDMQGYSGDFPGVATPSEQSRYLSLCPDPNLILQLPELYSPSLQKNESRVGSHMQYT